ncbi:metallophosphoesterase family protein [Arhodomonas sp. SL1]|uniref:metallophosphoesterase family protein n=1 Tax=Arhodomonas sp. SL1 TaxID=3425691 RepID=UPI003F883F48
MQLLCVGDIHLGRQASRLPSEVLERFRGWELSPAGAWRRTVEEALRRGVDAVLLAGDVVEQNDDFYEAYADLREGVAELAGAGVAVLAVAGNHDVEVLPRLADSIPEFRLLGRGGRWEAETLQGGDGGRVRVLGWSFPGEVVTTSPLAEGVPDAGTGAVPSIGVLHCDRDQTGSHHAPVRLAELEAAPVDAWLLGHIHRPDALAAPRPIGYLGSLTGMDPGESGPHGPWLLEVTGGELAIGQIPLAPLRWEEVAVPLDDLDDPAGVHLRITHALDAIHQRIAAGAARPRAVGCRLRLTGRSEHRQAVQRILSADDPRAMVQEREGIVYFIERWRLEALPAMDLEALANNSDPVGLLARKLLILRGEDGPERRALITEAQRRMVSRVHERDFAPLGAPEPDPDEVASILERAALEGLDGLLTQREGAE